MVKITSATNDARITQLEALLDGTVLALSPAVVDLQNTQIIQHDLIVEQGAVLGAATINLQDEQVQQADRLTILEGA